MLPYLIQQENWKFELRISSFGFRAVAIALFLITVTANAATITVTNPNDSGSGSLRQAMGTPITAIPSNSVPRSMDKQSRSPAASSRSIRTLSSAAPDQSSSQYPETQVQRTSASFMCCPVTLLLFRVSLSPAAPPPDPAADP